MAETHLDVTEACVRMILLEVISTEGKRSKIVPICIILVIIVFTTLSEVVNRPFNGFPHQGLIPQGIAVFVLMAIKMCYSTHIRKKSGCG